MQGQFDRKYQYIEVTHLATPDVLLQPHHFENTTFVTLEFISTNGSTIEISPTLYNYKVGLEMVKIH